MDLCNVVEEKFIAARDQFMAEETERKQRGAEPLDDDNEMEKEDDDDAVL